MFYGCENLQTVKIGNGVDTVHGGAFYGCKGLKDMWCMAQVPPQLPSFEDDDSISYPTFNDVSASMNLYVACGSTDVYSTADSWKEFNISEDCSITGFEAEEDTTFDSGINDITENSNTISIYPNPAKDNITINADGDVTIFNNNGQAVKVIKDVKGIKEINISDLQNGVYYVKMSDVTKKLIVE